MVPSRLAKRKTSPLKPPLLLLTTPVGFPAPGIVTSTVCLVTTSEPLASLVTAYSVDLPVPLPFTQNGPAPPNDTPQALTRFVSCNCATPGKSETRSTS